MGILVSSAALFSPFIQPYKYVHADFITPLPPSDIAGIALQKFPLATISSITYNGKEKSVSVVLIDTLHQLNCIYINPYNGRILKINNGTDWLQFLQNGYHYLFLPFLTGTLLILVLCVTGIIFLWRDLDYTNKRINKFTRIAAVIFLILQLSTGLYSFMAKNSNKIYPKDTEHLIQNNLQSADKQFHNQVENEGKSKTLIFKFNSISKKEIKWQRFPFEYSLFFNIFSVLVSGFSFIYFVKRINKKH